MSKLFVLALAATLPLAAYAAAPPPRVDGGTAVEVVVHGAPLTHYRIARGGLLSVRVEGPGTLELELRSASGRSKAAPGAELDGKALSVPIVPARIDHAARIDGAPVSRSVVLAVPLAAGLHRVTVAWPADAAADGLARIRFTDPLPLPGLIAALPLSDLPPPAPPLPLPGLTSAAAPPLRIQPATASGSNALTRTITAQPLRTAPLSSATPAADSFRPVDRSLPVERLATSAPSADRRWNLDLHLGAERSSESYTAANTIGGGGVELAYDLTPRVPILASGDFALAQQSYTSVQRGLDGGGPARADLNEQRIDALLASGYDFGPSLDKSGRLVALPMLGVHYLGLRNGAFPADLAGVDLLGRLQYALSAGFALTGTVGWTYNQLSSTSSSLAGAPKSDIAIQAGVSLPLAGNYAFEVAYRGDFLAFKYDLRASHGATVGVHSSF